MLSVMTEWITPHPAIRYTAAQVNKMKNQNSILDLIHHGSTVAKACETIGIRPKTYQQWLERDPEFKRQVFAARATRENAPREITRGKERDFVAFRKRHFGHDSPLIHVEIADVLEASPPGSISMVLIPPFFGKTTLISDWCNKKISHEPNVRILYISETAKLAVKVLGRIKRRMIEPRLSPEMIRLYGPFYEPGQEKAGKPWTENYITVNRAEHDEQDYTFEACGWDSQIYGIRSDIIILDDFQTLRRASPEVTAKMVERFQQDIMTRIDQNEGRIVIIGTRVAQRDFYMELVNQEICDQIIIRPAINWKGESLWPAKWPLDALEKQKKRVGKKVWARAYMMRPEDDGSATFDEASINSCKKQDLSIPVAVSEFESVWAGIDPAIDGFTGLTAAAISYDHMKLLWSERHLQLSTGEAILHAIEALWNRVRFNKLMVEAVSFQKALARDERLDRMRKKYGFEIVEHVTSSNKQDETFGVARMASSFIAGEIWIPNGDEATAHQFKPLLDELLDWRATIPTRLRVQDMVMSLWFIWMRWQQYRKFQREGTMQIKGTGMLTKPTGYTPGKVSYGGVLVRRR